MDEDQASEGEIQLGLVQDSLNRFVRMTLHARIGNGTWHPDTEIRRFRVEFDGLGDDGFRSRINDEVDYWTAARTVRAINPGDEISPHDLVSENVGPCTGKTDRFIDAELTPNGWLVTVKLARIAPVRVDHLEAAREFVSQAESAVERGHIRVVYECAFHAIEHLARAELLSYPPAAVAIGDTKTHSSLHSAYQLWAHLGNTDARYASLLNRVGALRSTTTYVPDGLRPTPAEARADLDVLAEMLGWVTEVVENDGALSVVRLHVARDLTAGQLVGLDDVTLRPPPRSSRLKSREDTGGHDVSKEVN